MNSALINTSIYDEVVRVTSVYLGPVADRFITRQIENHLHKNPRNLTRDDLNNLIVWIRVSVAMLTEDIEVVEEYIIELEKLAKPPSKRKGNDN